MDTDTLIIKKNVKITDYITKGLEPNGDGWKCLSPFTKEKTPSFFIKQESNGIQFFKCFSSGKAGDIFSFLMELENKSFSEVFFELAEKINLKPEFVKIKVSQKRYLTILEKINLKLKFNLTEESHSEVLKYLLETRKLTQETIDLFQLGWAEKDILETITRQSLDKDLAVDIGLIGKKENHFNIIKQRITIPLFSIHNDIIGIGSRKFFEDDKYGKYIYPPNNTIFKKANFLYGLNFSKDFIKSENKVILVEGNFDVMKLFQSNIKNIVGICGTTIYSTQVKLLQKYTNNFYICLDGDIAGYSKIIKNCKELIKQGIEIFIIELDNNLDPDSFIDKYGSDAFITKYNNAKNFFEFLSGRKEELIDILEELSLIIPKIESTIKQQYWYQNIEKYTGINIQKNIKKEYYEKQKKQELSLYDTIFLKLYINADNTGKEILEKNQFYETEFGKLLFLKLKNNNYLIDFTERETEFINSIKSKNQTKIKDIELQLKKIKEFKYLANL